MFFQKVKTHLYPYSDRNFVNYFWILSILREFQMGNKNEIIDMYVNLLKLSLILYILQILKD